MTHRMVHASRVAVAKAEGGSTEGVNRLEDIEVKEVSLVDRPANKRPFIVVKRSEEMSTQVRPDGKGGFTSQAKAGPPPGVPAEGADGGKKAKPIGKLDVPPGFKEMMGPMLAKASEKLKELADAVGSSSPAEIGDDGEMPGVPAEFSEALGQIQGTLDKLAGMWPSAPASPAEGEGDDMGDEPPVPTEMQMRATLDNIGKVLGHPKVEKAIVQKIGAKMAKDRFARLQSAWQTVGQIINELAPTPPAGGAGGDLGKGDGGALLKKFEELLTPVIQGVNTIGAAVKRQGAEIETIKKSRGMGNAAPNVEGSGATPVQKSAGEEVSWPLDMNAPVTRENVSKTESFFGDE